MNTKSIQKRILFIILLLVIAILVVFATKRRGTYEDVSVPVMKVSTSTASNIVDSPGTAEPESVAYSDTYTTGFEGDYYSVHYELKYKPDRMRIQSSGPRILIRDTAADQISTMTIFYNGAAGFSSTRQFWEEMRFCPECKRISPTIDFGESKDLIMFSNGQKEWAVFAREPGFVVAEYFSASHEAKQVISSLHMTVSKTAAASQSSAVSLFFFDKATQEDGTCTSTVRVERSVPNTPRIANAALLALIEGPTEEEKEKGLFSLIESNVWVQALHIEKDIATVDFSSHIDAYGDACQMEGAAAQIRHTLQQFPSVREVNITVDGKEDRIYGN